MNMDEDVSRELRALAERCIREIVADLPLRNKYPSARLALRSMLAIWRQHYRQR